MSEWTEKPLGHLADFVMGQSPDSSAISEKLGGLPFLQGCAEFGERNPRAKYFVNPPLRVAPKGSTLISVRAPVGTMNVADQQYGIGRGLAAIVGTTLSNRFLRYAIEINAGWLHRRSQGSTFLAIGSDDLRKLPIQVARDVRQCDAVAGLIATLDSQLEATEALIAKHDRVRAGLTQDLFTRGVDEHGSLRPSRDKAPHLYRYTEIGWIPNEWSVEKLDKLVRVIDCKHYTPKYAVEGYPVLRPRNIKMDGIDFKNVDYVSEADFRAMTDMYQPKRGDIVFSRNASFGVACRVETDVNFAIGQDVIVMTFKACDLNYMFRALESNSILRQIARASSGSTFGRINLGEIRKLIIPVSQPDEQIAIVSCLDKCDQVRAEFDLEKIILQSLKAGLMQDLLSGRVSADALLESEPT